MQLAARAGATVIATATPGERAELVRELGATHVVDYTGGVAAQVREVAPGGVRAALHLAGDAATLADLLVPGGRLASRRGFGCGVGERDDLVAQLVVATRRPRCSAAWPPPTPPPAPCACPSRTYPFERSAEAVERFRAGKTGRISVTFGG